VMFRRVGEGADIDDQLGAARRSQPQESKKERSDPNRGVTNKKSSQRSVNS
jgi:hypothetical protein